MSIAFPSVHIGRRYQHHERIGVGSMGEVYRVTDRLTGQQVALKRVLVAPESASATLDTGGMNLRLALAHEFQLLASLRHPHIIHVLDYGFDEARRPYFTMELLEGAQTLLEAGRNQPQDVQIDLLTQTLQALAYLHRRGVLHRDLKPANILVVADPRDPAARLQVKVMDFGLSVLREHQPDDEAAGTPSYMAPEVLRGFASSEASDLYAIGVMAYEMLVGRYPYDGNGTGSIVQAILASAPGFPSQLDRPLAAVLARLLFKTPEARYQSAEAVIGALAQATGHPLTIETAATRESFLQAAAFVGREREFDFLQQRLEAALNGQGSAILVGGESGVGKSRLLHELRTRAMIKGALVLRGQAIGDGGAPYEAWRHAIHWLALLSNLTPRMAAVLKPVAPDIETLVGEPVGPAPEIDPRGAQIRLLSVVSELVRRRDAPTIIMLEDLQWADDESLALLSWLSRLTAELPLLIIGSFRDDEAPALPARLPEMEVLSLERLSYESIVRLSEQMLGQAGTDPAVTRYLEQETEGNVFFLVEVVRALAEEAGQLNRVVDMTLPAHLIAGGVRRIVARRIERVPDRYQPLLRLAAVFGRALDLALLREAEPHANLDEWLAVAAGAAVLDIDDGRWRFAHDKLRDYLLQALAESERRDLHRRAALAIERVYPDAPEQVAALARHWGIAGDAAREARYLAAAGQQALTGGAYQKALALLDHALALEAMLDGETAARLRLALGEACYGLGDYDRAQSLLLEAARWFERYQTTDGIAHSSQLLGNIALARGRYAEATDWLRHGLDVARVAGDRLETGRLLRALGLVAQTVGDYAEAGRLFSESLDTLTAAGDPLGMAGAMSNLASIAHGEGRYEEARGLYEAALTQFEAVDFAWGVAYTLTSLGETEEALGNPARAVELHQRALQLCRDIGHRWGMALCLHHFARASITLGAYGDAHAALLEALGVTRAIQTTPLALAILATYARVLAAAGAREDALAILTFVISHPQAERETAETARGLQPVIGVGLSEAAYQAAAVRGQLLTLEAVMEFLLVGAVPRDDAPAAE